MTSTVGTDPVTDELTGTKRTSLFGMVSEDGTEGQTVWQQYSGQVAAYGMFGGQK
jgi:hypothetical protein